MATCAAWGTCASFSGRPARPIFVPAASWTPSWRGNLWSRTASRWRSCQDARHEVPPSDPGLRHGRTPVRLGESRVRLGEFWRETRRHAVRVAQKRVWNNTAAVAEVYFLAKRYCRFRCPHFALRGKRRMRRLVHNNTISVSWENCTFVLPKRYWSLSRFTVSKIIWLAFSGEKESWIADAVRILYLFWRSRVHE